jgi:hypothetical protein
VRTLTTQRRRIRDGLGRRRAACRRQSPAQSRPRFTVRVVDERPRSWVWAASGRWQSKRRVGAGCRGRPATLGCHALYVTIDVNACQLKGPPKKEGGFAGSNSPAHPGPAAVLSRRSRFLMLSKFSAHGRFDSMPDFAWHRYHIISGAH